MERVLRVAFATAILAIALPGIGHAATKADLEREVQRFGVECAKSDFLPDLYDCRCLTDGYRQGVLAANSTHRRDAIVRESRLLETCPAPRTSIFAWLKRGCESAFRTQGDHADFCNCSAERFTTVFRAQPPGSRREIESLKKNSMLACGLADRPPVKHRFIPFGGP
jgi:hypothetical protein